MAEVTLNIAGLSLSEVIPLISELAIPWRRKHSQEMSKLEVEEKQLRNEEIQLDLIAKEGEQRLRSVELEERRLALEERRLAIEERKVQLHQTKIQLALDVLDRIKPNLPETEKIGYVIKLLGPLESITTSPFELTGVSAVVSDEDEETSA